MFWAWQCIVDETRDQNATEAVDDRGDISWISAGFIAVGNGCTRVPGLTSKGALSLSWLQQQNNTIDAQTTYGIAIQALRH